MNAEIITIGDELLIGQTVDTNSAWIARKLGEINIPINQITSIADSPGAIRDTLNKRLPEADLVIITGGLGPTNDDITKKTLADYFETELVMNQEVADRIDVYFKERGFQMLEANKRQAMLPQSATIIPNMKGTASGMWFEQNGKVVISMPGVPYEMKHLMHVQILDKLKSKYHPPVLIHRTLMTVGLGESRLASKIEKIENQITAEGIKLAYLPSAGMVKLRLTATGSDKIKIEKRLKEISDGIIELISEYFFGYDDVKFEEVVGQMLKERKLTIGTAESCTAGYISNMLTRVPGSSEYFQGSFITYSYKLKEKLLGVDPDVLIKKGAVSEEVVEQMAINARKRLLVDYVLAASGIAGPGGGLPEKPVGTVWIALAGPKRCISKCFHFGNSRKGNIRLTGIYALDMLRKELKMSS